MYARWWAAWRKNSSPHTANSMSWYGMLMFVKSVKTLLSSAGDAFTANRWAVNVFFVYGSGDFRATFAALHQFVFLATIFFSTLPFPLTINVSASSSPETRPRQGQTPRSPVFAAVAAHRINAKRQSQRQRQHQTVCTQFRVLRQAIGFTVFL